MVSCEPFTGIVGGADFQSDIAGAVALSRHALEILRSNATLKSFEMAKNVHHRSLPFQQIHHPFSRTHLAFSGAFISFGFW
jgi:hypothetical protein